MPIAITPTASSRLLGPGDPSPVIAENPGAGSPFLIVCDHAGRATPARLGRLGLGAAAFDTHIAWDIGALALSRRLGRALGCRVISQAYSRLVIDCNRAPGHASSIVEISDGVRVPGNIDLSRGDVEARVQEIHAPYHAFIGRELDARAAAGRETVLVCVHSFTPAMAGAARPWHVGVLHGGASPICDALLALLRREPGLAVGDNEPYAMDGTDFTAPHHAWRRGLDVVELEVRQDWLTERAGPARAARLFARLLALALETAGEGLAGPG